MRHADLPGALDVRGRVGVQQHDLNQRTPVEGAQKRTEKGIPQPVLEELCPGGENPHNILTRRNPLNEPIMIKMVEDTFRRRLKPITRAAYQPVTDLGLLRTIIIIK